MKKYTIFYALFFMVSNQAFAQAKCANLFDSQSSSLISSEEFLVSAAKGNESLVKIIKSWRLLDNLESDLITGKRNPTWDDFNNLENIETELKSAISENKKNPEQLKKIQDLLSDFDLQVSATKNLRTSQNEVVFDSKYGPTDYGLRFSYLEKLKRLNKFLPKKMKFIAYKLPIDLNKLQINKDAIEIVDGIAKMHDAFMVTEGFKSHEELTKQLSRSSEDIQKANKVLESDDLDFAMLRPVNGRFWIEKIGFHNQYVTKSSKGYMGDVGRQTAEGSYINEKYDSYSKRDDDLKPKYGFLKPKPGSNLTGSFPHYGEDVYFFEKNNLKERVTFTLGDSLNSINGIGRWSYGRDTNIYEPLRWDHLFTPWSRKEVMVPFIAESIKNNQLQIDRSIKESFGAKNETSIARSHTYNEYLELQYWGTLTLENVKAFAFTTEPPKGDFLKSLLDRKITIYDYTDRSTYKPWKP